MKKLLLLFCLLISSAWLLGQKWSFGASLHAGFSGYTSSEDYYYPDSQFGDYSNSAVEKLQPLMGAGFWLERQLARRWGIQLGLDYIYANSFSRNESMNLSSVGVMTSFSQNDQHISQQQLRLPWSIQFYLGNTDRSWRPFLSVGTQLQFLLSQTNSTDSFYGSGGQDSETYSYVEKIDLRSDYLDYSRWQLGGHAAIGLAGKRWNVSIRRTWTKGSATGNYSGCDCICGSLINSFCPHVYYENNRAFRQLQQLGLRLQYELF